VTSQLPSGWTLNANSQGSSLTANVAASPGVAHKATSLTAKLMANAAAGATAITIIIRDGATGVGTALATFYLATPAGTASDEVDVTGNWLGTPGNAMSIDMQGPGASWFQYFVVNGEDL
jgi:hypothetical protein